MREVTQTVTIAGPLEEVYGAFADLRRWPEILPDTVGVEILYSDGYNEEFEMTVARPGGPETVRGVRYCRPPDELELVQTTPPPGFERMRGVWSFQPTDEGTTVTAARSFELGAEDPRPPEDVAEHLARILRHNLELFRRAVEADGPH